MCPTWGNKGWGASLEIALGVVFGAVVAASLWAASRFITSPGRVVSEEGQAMRAALHAATATLPHLRRGERPRGRGAHASRPGARSAPSPQRAIRSCGTPSWSRALATMKSTMSSTDRGRP